MRRCGRASVDTTRPAPWKLKADRARRRPSGVLFWIAGGAGPRRAVGVPETLAETEPSVWPTSMTQNFGIIRVLAFARPDPPALPGVTRLANGGDGRAGDADPGENRPALGSSGGPVSRSRWGLTPAAAAADREPDRLVVMCRVLRLKVRRAVQTRDRVEAAATRLARRPDALEGRAPPARDASPSADSAGREASSRRLATRGPARLAWVKPQRCLRGAARPSQTATFPSQIPVSLPGTPNGKSTRPTQPLTRRGAARRGSESWSQLWQRRPAVVGPRAERCSGPEP